MKAKFFLLGLCALALAACSIDEVSQINDTNAVTFKATTITRADVTTTNNLQEFSVWAWNTDNNGVTNEFMDDVIAKRNGTSSTFTTSPLYFWPTGTVDFYALTPATELCGIEDGVEYAYLGGTLNEGSDTDPTWTYTGNVAKAQIENGNIVIDAVIPSKPEEQIDLCYAVALNKESGSVPMNFRHALSQIAFKAKNTNEAMEVKIADVSVCSVYKEGVFTIGKYDTSEHLATSDLGTDGISGTQGVWVLTTTDPDTQLEIKGRYLVDMTSNIVDVPTGGDVVELVDPYGTLMLLPQEVEAWDPETDYNDQELGSYIRILCNVMESGSQIWPNNNAEAESSELGDAFWTDPEGVEYAEIAIPVEALWEQGYRYTYTIVFGEGLGYYPPDDPNTDLEGTPVLVPITFTVTVDEFQDATGVDVSTDTPDLTTISVSSSAELKGAIHMGYSQIVLEDDITLEATNLVFDYDCELVLGGYTLTGVDLYEDEQPCGNGANSIIFITGGTLTVTGPGTIMTNGTASDSTGGKGSGDTDVFWLDGGNLIINGGTYYGGSWQDPTGEYYTASSATIYAMSGYAYIYDGEFYSGYSKTFKSVSILNCQDTPRANGETWIYVYGGTYHGEDPASNNSEDSTRTGLTNYCPEGYATYALDEVDDLGNTVYVVYSTNVTTPTDLQALVDAGASEITLDADITLEKHDLYFTEDCELNLNGHTLTGIDVADDEDCSNANSVIFVYGGTLTVNGPGTITTEGSGKGTNGNGSGDTSIFWLNGGNLVINGGTYNGGSWKDTAGEDYTDSSATVYVQSGFAYIYDGTFTCGVAAAFNSDGWKTAEGYTESIINIYDSARKTDPKTGWAYVYGGTYRNFDPGNNPCEGANTDFCADGYASTQSGPDGDGNYWFTVTAE